MRLLINCLIILVSVSPVWAATYTIEKDGSGDFTVIQDAVDIAATGDTILVGPGRFNNDQVITTPGWTENVRIVVRQDGLTIIGSGIGNTIIGPEEPWVLGQDSDRGISCSPIWGSTSLYIEGISFEHMRFAINCDPDFDLTVDSCTFTGHDVSIVGDRGILMVDSCSFSEVLKGGGFVMTFRNEVYISNCTFTTNSPWYSNEIAINLQGVSVCEIQGCEFDGGRTGIYCDGSTSVSVNSCTFAGQKMYGILNAETNHMEVSDCVLSNQDIGIANAYSSIFVISTSITDVTGASIGFYHNDQLTVNNCVLSRGPEYAIRQYRYCSKAEDDGLPHLDFTNNDWGTVNADSIAAWIKVCDYVVDFIPYIGQPVSTEQKNWGDVKALYR